MPQQLGSRPHAHHKCQDAAPVPINSTDVYLSPLALKHSEGSKKPVCCHDCVPMLDVPGMHASRHEIQYQVHRHVAHHIPCVPQGGVGPHAMDPGCPKEDIEHEHILVHPHPGLHEVLPIQLLEHGTGELHPLHHHLSPVLDHGALRSTTNLARLLTRSAPRSCPLLTVRIADAHTAPHDLFCSYRGESGFAPLERGNAA
mmetsp:Transcript_5166/g.14845  ORF Transcript_5166/g.14845 Transcript_5166/m.14845 type:complete len:200 (+) Transcript_5166:967-1566(+)